jgi:hypothetical protein
MASTQVILSLTLCTKYQAHPGRQEWVSMVECISADGTILALFHQVQDRFASNKNACLGLGYSCQYVKRLEESKKIAQEVLQWFTLKGNTKWLLIFDNIDKASFKDEKSNQTSMSLSYDITEYFPRSDTGTICYQYPPTTACIPWELCSCPQAWRPR